MPYDPPIYPSSIPDTTSDLPDRTDDVSWIYAARYNEIKKELVAALTALGTMPQGSKADLKTRLAITLNDDGTLKSSLSPTFVNLTLTGLLTSRNIVPASDATYEIGSWDKYGAGAIVSYLTGFFDRIEQKDATFHDDFFGKQNELITPTGDGGSLDNWNMGPQSIVVRITGPNGIIQGTTAAPGQTFLLNQAGAGNFDPYGVSSPYAIVDIGFKLSNFMNNDAVKIGVSDGSGLNQIFFMYSNMGGGGPGVWDADMIMGGVPVNVPAIAIGDGTFHRFRIFYEGPIGDVTYFYIDTVLVAIIPPVFPGSPMDFWLEWTNPGGDVPDNLVDYYTFYQKRGY